VEGGEERGPKRLSSGQADPTDGVEGGGKHRRNIRACVFFGERFVREDEHNRSIGKDKRKLESGSFGRLG